MCMLDPASTAILKLANTTGSASLGAADRAAPQTALLTGGNPPVQSVLPQGGYQYPARNQLDRKIRLR